MKKLAKVLPLMAMILGITVFAVNGMITKLNNADEQEWMLKAPSLDPSNPNNYEPASGSKSDCNGEQEVCVVEAPADASDSNIPDFTETIGLEAALNGDLDHEKIYKGPFDPQS